MQTQVDKELQLDACSRKGCSAGLRGFFSLRTSCCERCRWLLTAAADVAIVGHGKLLAANHRRRIDEIEAAINAELFGKERFRDAKKE